MTRRKLPKPLPRRQRAAQRLYGLASRMSPDLLPVRLVTAINRLADNAPFWPRPPVVRGGALADPALARELADVELGYWALGPRTIELVRARAIEALPSTIVEFGSGASTILLALLASGWPGSRVLSIEQDPGYGARTAELLAERGLADPVQILVLPLVDQVVLGVPTQCYPLDERFVQALGGRLIDLVVIDGPAGPAGVRLGTVPLIADYLAPGAVILLDDAFRPGELDVARRWSRLGYLRIHGIVPIEKGVLVATVNRRDASGARTGPGEVPLSRSGPSP